MKKTALLTFVLLLTASIGFAQDTYSQPTQQEQQTTSAGQQTASAQGGESVRGCLSGSDGNFTLRDPDGKSWTIDAGGRNLNEHSGHTVEITGQKSENSITVSDIRHVSESCEGMQASAAGTDQSQTAAPDQSQQQQQPPPSDTTGTSTAGQQPMQQTPDTTGQATGESAAVSGQQQASDMNQQQSAQAGAPSATTPPPSDTQSNLAGQTDQTAQQPPADQTAQQPPADKPLGAEVAEETQQAGQEVAEETQQAAGEVKEETQQALDQEPGTEEQAADAGQLPQTASPLPLLALLGLGSIGAGLISRLRK
jgi:hypothetical protein